MQWEGVGIDFTYSSPAGVDGERAGSGKIKNKGVYLLVLKADKL